MGQMLGCVKVKESNVGIKEVFDKYDDVLQPGCHYVPWYFGSRLAANVSLGFKLSYVPIQVKTKDDVVFTVNAYFQYRVLEEMVVKVHYKFGNHTTHIARYVADAVQGLVSNRDLDSVYQDRTEIAIAVQKQIGKELSASGFEIIKISLEIKLDEIVKKAMDSALKLRLKTKEKSEAKYLTGVGMARQFQAIADGVNVPNASVATSSKDIMDMVMADHYLDTIKEVSAYGKYNAVFVANGNVDVKDIVKDGIFLLQGNDSAKDTAASKINNAPPLEINEKTPPTKS